MFCMERPIYQRDYAEGCGEYVLLLEQVSAVEGWKNGMRLKKSVKLYS